MKLGKLQIGFHPDLRTDGVSQVCVCIHVIKPLL
jgi:hypothetical protein